jgi:transposase
MKRRQSLLVKLISSCQKLLQKSRILKYSCKFSKKVYTQHQHILLLVLKTYLRRTYREIAELIEELPNVRKLIGLKKVPHFTTPQKFLQRFSSLLFDSLIGRLVSGISGKLTVAIDATGFSSSYTSRYYVMKLFGETSIKSFMKLSVAAETSRKLILAMKARKAPAHDNRDFIPLLKSLKGMKVSHVIADKAYDAERNHVFIRKKLNATAVIPVRENITSRQRTKFRRRMKKLFEIDESCRKLYRKRNVVEAVFSVLKRKFGDSLSGRDAWQRRKELKLRALTYNLYRTSHCFSLLLLEVFYKAPAWFCGQLPIHFG